MNDPFVRISSMLESAKDLTAEVAASAASRMSSTASEMNPQEIIKCLESHNEREVETGLKAVVCYVCKNKPTESFFPHIVKNINSSSFRVKRLVYIYLSRFASINPDMTLLSINSIQKSLTHTDPLIRALSLRTISSINVPSIAGFTIMAVKKAYVDLSPTVRKACAICISKIYRNPGTTSGNKKNLIVCLAKLMTDSNVSVLNSSIVCFGIICPDNFSLIHPLFRRYCALMPQFDDWTKIVLVNILTNYCRLFLPKPKIVNLASPEWIYMPENEFEILGSFPVYEVEFHKDLELFLDSLRYLVHTNNAALVLAVVKAFFFLSPAKTMKDYNLNEVLLRRLNDAQLDENLKIFACQIVLFTVLKKDSTMFQNSYKKLFISTHDSFIISKLKLNILSLIINENNIKSIVGELKYYATAHPDTQVAIESIKTLGKCSQINLHWNDKILKWLLKQVTNIGDNHRIVNECLTVIRYLIQQSPENNIGSVIRLSSIIISGKEEIEPEAKSSIIWLVGEFIKIIPKFVPDFIRTLLKGFKDEEDATVRYNILLLVAKYCAYDVITFQKAHSEYGDDFLSYYTLNDGKFTWEAFKYVIQLCKFDNSYDIRDQARFFDRLLSSNRTELADLILLAPKPVPSILLTNQPILNNLASPKLMDEYYPETPELNSKEEGDENASAVEVSPQPSNKNSFSEKKLNNELLSVPKCISDQISELKESNEINFGNLLMPSLLSYMCVPDWADPEKLLPDTVRDSKDATAESNKAAAKSFSNSVKNNDYSRPVSPAPLKKNKYKMQSLDEFLSSRDL